MQNLKNNFSRTFITVRVQAEQGKNQDHKIKSDQKFLHNKHSPQLMTDNGTETRFCEYITATEAGDTNLVILQSCLGSTYFHVLKTVELCVLK